jgi:FMN phosphatase YigB (HAD superfamily)
MLIFDFDGVLMDSLPEMAVTAYSTLKGELVTNLDQIPEGALTSYFRNRFHIQPIGDAPVFMNWCLEIGQFDHEKTLSQEEYDSILREIDEPVAQRTTRFFEMRGRFKKKDIDAWLKLNTPVQPLWRLLAEKQKGSLVVLTNKNREAVVALCNHFDLEISSDNVYSGDTGTTKIDNMKQIMQRFNDSNYTFIDDSVKNLREIDEHFNKGKKAVELLFATWGYTGPNDVRLAASSGYRVVTIDELMQFLKRKLFLPNAEIP